MTLIWIFSVFITDILDMSCLPGRLDWLVICSISIPSIILSQAIMYYSDNARVVTASVDLLRGIQSILCDGIAKYLTR